MISRLLRFSIENRLLAVAATAIIATTGVIAYRNLAIDVFPDPSPTLVQIYTDAEGMAPEEIERLISYPIESAIFGLPKVSSVRSFSTFGLSIVDVYFEDGTDIYWARQLVAPRLQEIDQDLPAQAHEPEMGPIATGLGMVYLYYLEGDGYSTIELRTIQDWLVKYELKSVPEVSQVLSIGGDVKQYQILVDPQALLKYDLTISDLIEKTRRSNQNAGASFITKGSEEFVVRSLGLVETLADLEHTVVASEQGTPIYLSNVADVEIMPAIRRGSALANGEGEKVVGMVLKLFDSNTARVIDQIEERIAVINTSLPEGVEIVPFYNQASLVRQCFSTVAGNLALGILLVIIVLFLFMGDFRPALLAILSLPFSILFTFILMQQIGLAADLMSFGGLAIAIGLIADAAIIFVENISRRLRESHESRAAAILEAGEEVARPLFFAIVIIILVFLPIFTLTGVEGTMFRPMGYAISFALVGSLIFAFLAIPAFASLFFRDGGRAVPEAWLMRAVRRRFTPFFEVCQRHRRRVLLITGAILVFGTSLILFMGREYIPSLEEGTLHVRATLNPNISLEETISVATRIEQELLGVPEVTGVMSRIGRGETGSHAHFVNDVEILVQIRPIRQWEQFRHKDELLQEIDHRLEHFPGMSVNITQPIAHNLDELITGVKAQLAIKLYGDDFDVLQEISHQVEDVLLEIPGAANVQVEQFANQDHIQIALNRPEIARFGLNIGDIQETIEAAIGGVTIGQVYEDQRRFDIFLRFQAAYRSDIEQIENLLVPLPSGGQIPLQMLADVEITQGPRLIRRENNRRYITIQCNVRGRDIGRFVSEAQGVINDRVALPAGYLMRWGGQFELHNRANQRLTIITPITFLLVALMLFTVFSSFREVAVILINIPLALSGGTIALWLSGLYLSVPASIGFIAIFGIALEDGLVLISKFRRNLARGMPIREAVAEGVQTKLRPVLMTTFTTIFGVMPLLLARGPGAEIQRPLATVVVGGLITSTMVTLIVLPLVYQSLRRPVAPAASQPVAAHQV
jgi:cobalt-zinc-cadmium resistance protein CzcA